MQLELWLQLKLNGGRIFFQSYSPENYQASVWSQGLSSFHSFCSLLCGPLHRIASDICAFAHRSRNMTQRERHREIERKRKRGREIQGGNKRMSKREVIFFFSLKQRCGIPSLCLYSSGQKPFTNHLMVTV